MGERERLRAMRRAERQSPAAIQTRFERYFIPVTESGCWIWIGANRNPKYGSMSLNAKVTPAHRVSWIIYRGQIPEGLFVLHKCDIGFCVNPNHLFLGTQQDNVDDMMRKGRQKPSGRRGTQIHFAKLTEEQVLKIREDRRLPMVIARECGVSDSEIRSIKSGRAWAWLR